MILTWASVAVILSWPPSWLGQFTLTEPILLVGISNCHRWVIIIVVGQFKQAIDLFQRAGDAGAEMRTCDLLASAERLRGHLDGAEAWYARARELAEGLGDRAQLAVVAQNTGILYQNRAAGTDDPAQRAAWLRRAVASVEESLEIRLELNNLAFTAESYSQLGLLHHMLGDQNEAEENAQQSLRIRESLGLPDVYKDYGILALIARARGDAAAAARWQAQYEAKRAELDRLARGEGTPAAARAQQEAEKQLAALVLALAQAAFQARAARSPLPPEAAEALAQLEQLPMPRGAVPAFLRAVAAGGEPPAVPPGLPEKVGEILEALAGAVGA
jgi:hypothetical protein